MEKTRKLLTDFVPESYDLFLKVDPEKLTFSGTTIIKGEIQKKSNNIAFHAHGLTIDSATVNGVTCKSQLDPDNDLLEIFLTEEADAGKIVIEITASGVINDSMTGIYPSNFEHDGKKKRLISTQLESHHAREVFPCIDEPAAKAIFQLSLQSPANENHVALSNTPVREELSEDGWTNTTFEPTPKMSTYLFAFAFGEMKSLEGKTKAGTIVRTWATPDNVEKTRFALETAIKSLDFYNEYFEIPYPLEKCDMVAVPDFAAGAMENWGLVTYRESAMLVDEDITALATKQWVALVVAHELAHQWFGNLVTMEWWTDLWLNEGFASWVEYLAVNHIFPEWDMWTEFVTDDFLRGQALDSLASSHPIEVDVPDPDEIRNIFDAISYSKGASVIRMLQSYLGPETFRIGLAHYLKQHKYANAKTKDLWNALEATSNKPVSEFMNTWTTQTGFPLLTVASNGKSLDLTQQRYLINPRARAANTTVETWPIPVHSPAIDLEYTLSEERGSVESEESFPKLNSAQSGFYMVNYNDEWLQSLAKDVRKGTITAVDRLGMLNDAFQLAKAGYRSSQPALDLLAAYSDESHPAVWDVIAGQLASIRKVMSDADIDSFMEPMLRELTRDQVDVLGWREKSDDTHHQRLLRPTILATAARGKNKEILTAAYDAFSVAQLPSDLDANMRGVVLGAISRRGIHEDYQKLTTWFMETADAQLKSSIAGGLCSFRDEKHIKASLALITTDTVRLQEVVHWISNIFSNREAHTMSWEWLKAHWPWLSEKFGRDIMTFMYFPRIAGGSSSDKEFISDYDSFFKTVETPGIARAVEQGREAIEWQSAWKEREQESLKSYFKNWQQPPSN